MAAVVSFEDLEALERLEGHLDKQAAAEALVEADREGGTMSLDALRTELEGLD